MKLCTKCGKLLDESGFSKGKAGKNGHRSQCKSCDKKYLDEYYHGLNGRGRLLLKLQRLKGGAKNKGIPFIIDPPTFIGWYRLQKKNCHYCGSLLTHSKLTKHRLCDLTFDRKNPNEGYSLGNIVFCCRRCNIIKGNWFTEEQMLEIASKYLSKSNIERGLKAPRNQS